MYCKSSDTIAFIALSVTLNFLIWFLKGEKVILLGTTSCPLAEPVNWVLHAIAFLFATDFCYLSGKDAEREQGRLCITIALNGSQMQCTCNYILLLQHPVGHGKHCKSRCSRKRKDDTLNLKVKSKSDMFFSG